MKLNLLTEKTGRAATIEGPYEAWKTDPHPYYLVLGYYVHPSTHNRLMAGINLNYTYSKLGENGIKLIKNHLPQIMRHTKEEQKEGPRPLYGKTGRYWVARGIDDPDMQYIMINFYRSPRIDKFTAVRRGFMSFEIPEEPPPEEAPPKTISVEEFKTKSAKDIAEMVEEHQEETGVPPMPPEKIPPEKAPSEEPPSKPLIKPPPKPKLPPEIPEEPPKAPEVPERPPRGPEKPKSPLDTRLEKALRDIGKTGEPKTAEAKRRASEIASRKIERKAKGPIGTPPSIVPPPEEIE